jgi:uncharacterized membrane protein
MKIASLATAIILSAASTMSAAAMDQAEFIKKPKVMGSQLATVSTFRSTAGGPVINCSGMCFSDHVTRHWQCKVQGDEIMHCVLNCNPPKGMCLPE